MRTIILALAGAAIITSTTAQAADDAGLRLHSYRGAGTQSAMGAQLGLSLKLDSRRVVRDSERVRIGFAAGPVLAVQDARTGAVRYRQSQLASFTLRPGYSASVTLAGQPIVTSYSVQGAAEKEKDDAAKPETTKDKRSGPSTALLVVGGTLILVTALYLITLDKVEDDFEDALGI
jgi:hypothetical protein